MKDKCLHFKNRAHSFPFRMNSRSLIFCTIFNLRTLIIVSFHSSEASTGFQKHVPWIQSPWPVIWDVPLSALFPSIYDFIIQKWEPSLFEGKLLCSSFFKHCVLISGFKPFMFQVWYLQSLLLILLFYLQSFYCSCFLTTLEMHLVFLLSTRGCSTHFVYIVKHLGNIG